MYDTTYKVIIFGDRSSARTTFTERFLGTMSDESMTIGVEFYTKSLTFNCLKIKLKIWDFRGEERFRFLLPTYVRGARGGLFLYDVTKYSSLAHMGDWLSIIRKELKPEEKFSIIAVGIVLDEEIEREVSANEAIKTAKSLKLNGYIECNLQTGKNVEKAFEALTRLMSASSGYRPEGAERWDDSYSRSIFKSGGWPPKKTKRRDDSYSRSTFKSKKRDKSSPKLPPRQPLPPPKLAEPQRPKRPESIKEAIMRELKGLFSKQVKPEQRILDFESEEVKSLMKQYEEETTKGVLAEGVITKGFINWLKGEKVKTLDMEDLLDIVRMSSEKIELFQFIENGIRSKDDVNDALEVLARLMLSYRYEHYKKDLERFFEKIKQWDDYNEDKYPYSDILKLFSGDNEYRERFLMKIGRWRD